MSARIDIRRITFLVVGVVLGVLVFIFVDPGSSLNGRALAMIVTAFSILAGIMIAVIALLGDPAAVYRGSWRVASAHRRQIRHRLYRYAILFYVYLVVIGLACASALLDGIICPHTSQLIGRIAVSAGAAAFFWSLGLPSAIIRAQIARLDEEVEERRKIGKGKTTSLDHSESE